MYMRRGLKYYIQLKVKKMHSLEKKELVFNQIVCEKGI